MVSATQTCEGIYDAANTIASAHVNDGITFALRELKLKTTAHFQLATQLPMMRYLPSDHLAHVFQINLDVSLVYKSQIKIAIWDYSYIRNLLESVVGAMALVVVISIHKYKHTSVEGNINHLPEQRFGLNTRRTLGWWWRRDLRRSDVCCKTPSEKY